MPDTRFKIHFCIYIQITKHWWQLKNIYLHMFVWFQKASHIYCTAQIPLQFFVLFFLPCGLIFKTHLTFIFPLVMSLFNLCSHSQPLRYCSIPKQIKGMRKTAALGFYFSGTGHGRVLVGKYILGSQTFPLLNSFDDSLWGWTRGAVGGVSATIFDVEDLHLYCLLRPCQVSGFCAIFWWIYWGFFGGF